MSELSTNRNLPCTGQDRPGNDDPPDLGAGSYPEVNKRAAQILLSAPPLTPNDALHAMVIALCERIDTLDGEIAELRFELLG